jgi:hypothetical protein
LFIIKITQEQLEGKTTQEQLEGKMHREGTLKLNINAGI